jgi:cell division septation protein DedD
MRGEFDDEELEPVLPRPDTELTLGPKVLAAIFSGLVLLCGLFFGLGYAVGHHATPPASIATSAPVTPKETQSDAAKPKPSATTSGKVAKMAAPYAGPKAASPAVQPTDADRRGHGNTAHPASFSLPLASDSGAFMVQIAAVAHKEDADVLQGALRKRGYAVTVRRDDADRLLHVRIGPFKSRDEAAKWRKKLLNDGYNAIVQP